MGACTFPIHRSPRSHDSQLYDYEYDLGECVANTRGEITPALSRAVGNAVP